MQFAAKALVSLCLMQGVVVAARTSAPWSEPGPKSTERVASLDAERVQDADEEEDDRLAVPSSGEIKQARAILKSDYRAEYKKKKREDLLALAQEFLELSGDELWRPRRRYVLQEEALALAVKAGALDVAASVALSMGETFQVDSLVLRFDALKSIHPKHRAGVCGLDTLAHSLVLAQELRYERNFSLADKSLDRAQGCAKNSGDAYLRAQLKQLRKRLAWEEDRWAKVLRATSPVARARFEFLIEGRRLHSDGLLRPGEEDQLPKGMALDVELAQNESAGPKSAAAMLELAALWNQRAEQGDWVDVLPFRRRALTWSMKAMQKLPPGLERRSLEQEVLEFYRARHDPIGGVPVDPWELSTNLIAQDLAVARSLFWRDFSILTKRRWTYSKHSVRLHNLSAQTVPEERLQGQLSWLCKDGSGAPSVVRRELGYSARGSSLLDTVENEGEFVVWGTGGNIPNSEIERANNGEWIPENAHLLITLDGMPIFESLWKEPTSLWWLE